MSIFQDDALTQGQRLVWFALREMAVSGTAPNNCSAIAEHMDSARSYVSRTLQTLDRLGWISREPQMIHIHESVSDRSEDVHTCDSNTQNRDSQTRNRDSQERDSQTRKGFPSPPLVSPQESISFNPLSEPHPILSQRGGESDDSPSWWQTLLKPIWNAEPLPDDHPALWEFSPGDWRWEAGDYVLRQLREHDMLNSHYSRRLDEGCRPGKIASEWADTFRLLKEQDGWSREEIGITMQWLFETDNWWRKNRTIQSAASLRRKGSDGTTKFDKILQSALSDYEQRQQQQTTREEIEQGWDQAIEEVEEQLGDELDRSGSADPSGDAIPRQPSVEGNAV